MKIKNLITSTLLASTLVAVPAQAAAERVASNVRGESQIEAGTSAYIIGFLAVLAVGLGIYFATDDDDDAPRSP